MQERDTSGEHFIRSNTQVRPPIRKIQVHQVMHVWDQLHDEVHRLFIRYPGYLNFLHILVQPVLIRHVPEF